MCKQTEQFLNPGQPEDRQQEELSEMDNFWLKDIEKQKHVFSSLINLSKKDEQLH